MTIKQKKMKLSKRISLVPKNRPVTIGLRRINSQRPKGNLYM